MWDMRRTRRFMNHADQVVGSFRRVIQSQYGFVADPRLPVWKNVENRLGDLGVDEFSGGIMRNMACHNLLTKHDMPAGTAKLLGLGLNYCLKEPSILATSENTYKRMTADVRRMYALRASAISTGYIPKLYVKSDFNFEEASDEIEDAIKDFRDAITSEQLQRSRMKKPQPNLTFHQLKLISYFKNNDTFIIVQGDKNLGPCILERKNYIYRACKEHLGNSTNYRQLTEAQARVKYLGLSYLFDAWLSKYRPRRDKEPPADHICITNAEETFLRRAKSRNPDRLARFRCTAKVHKDPWKVRPIVCCAGTWINDWSKWLDYWLQEIKQHVPTYLKDSQQVLDELKLIDLPPGAKLFTCDANSMYNNIDTEHAIEVITWWLNDLDAQNKLGLYFPLEAVIEAMKIIMRNNLFEFGDCYFLQLLGTAMGTSAAVMWATIYYAYHEVHTLIPNHGQHLLYFKRFIDDMIGVWIGNATTDWLAFCEDVNNFQELSTSVDFMDLTLSIVGSKIVSKTYQKKMNLYLYIPPSSAHPAGCLKGTVYGLIRRYYAQNTFRHDFVRLVSLLYRRLIDRGWEREAIRSLILEACRTIQRKAQPPAALPAQPSSNSLDDENKNRLFIHLKYHPDDIPRQRVQQLYQEHCGEVLLRELGIRKPTIAYSRPKNLSDLITKAKLHQASGESSSIILGEFRAGLAPP
jgi:hypothetical protein